MLDIARNVDFYDDDFVAWVKKKAEDSDDMEEREGLRGLGDMVTEVHG